MTKTEMNIFFSQWKYFSVLNLVHISTHTTHNTYKHTYIIHHFSSLKSEKRTKQWINLKLHYGWHMCKDEHEKNKASENETLVLKLMLLKCDYNSKVNQNKWFRNISKLFIGS